MRRLPESSSKGNTPVAGGAVPRVLLDAAPLLALGVLLFSSDARFTFLDDEATILSNAAQPLRAVIAAAFRSSPGAPPHPLLYDLLLHVWLSLTGGAPTLLRVPSFVFFLAGVWLLSRAALRIGGQLSGTSMIWLTALWPYGFHYARLATGYSFAFFLIAALTWAYLSHAAEPSLSAWALVCLLAILLIWTSYFGWILLAVLGVEEMIRNRGRESATAARLALTAALLAVTSVPLWRSFASATRDALGTHLSWRAAIFNLAYHLYVLMVSESVAPWYWKFGIPAALAVVASLVLVFVGVHGQARRFLLYAALLLACMGVIGTVNSERLLLVAPWFLLPAAVAIGTVHASTWRRLIALSLAIVAGVGWYGVLARVYYAQPPFVEPWGDLAVEAGNAIRQGGAVIGNDPAFFLYLTYAFRAPQSISPWRYVGSLPSVVNYPQVWSADDWEAAGRPLRPTVLWIAKAPESSSVDEASKWLDQNCGDRIDRHLARDSSYVWRQRFLDPAAAGPWLIEVRQYSCGANSAAPPAATPPVAAPPPAKSR